MDKKWEVTPAMWTMIKAFVKTNQKMAFGNWFEKMARSIFSQGFEEGQNDILEQVDIPEGSIIWDYDSLMEYLQNEKHFNKESAEHIYNVMMKQ